MPTSPTPDPVIRAIVDAMRTLAGPHPGFRPVHAKGLVCSGTFRASADASRVTRAPHFTGQAVPTIVRFANAAGNPDVHDGVPNVRSIAVKFQLSGGKSADILANSIEGFVARTPEELLEFLRAQLPPVPGGKPDPEAVPRFLASHPGGRAFVERLMKRPVPASYAQTTYFAEHAFRFTAADGTSRFGRYRFVPQAGEVFLSPEDAGKRSPSFLREELEGRHPRRARVEDRPRSRPGRLLHLTQRSDERPCGASAPASGNYPRPSARGRAGAVEGAGLSGA